MIHGSTTTFVGKFTTPLEQTTLDSVKASMVRIVNGPVFIDKDKVELETTQFKVTLTKEESRKLSPQIPLEIALIMEMQNGAIVQSRRAVVPVEPSMFFSRNKGVSGRVTVPCLLADNDESLDFELEELEYVGGGTSFATYTHTQNVSSATWAINHNLNRQPISVTVYNSAGEQVIFADVKIVDNNNITVSFNGAFSGIAYVL